MFDDLIRTIDILRERIRSYRGDMGTNETRTRMALIDPLLTALGWDTSDPALVTPEYSIENRRADYALKPPSSTLPAMFIEAKKLGEGFEQHREQMTNYSNMAGVRYAALTDGDRWEVYEVFKQAPLNERRVVELSISQNPSYKCALQLLLLWRPNLELGSPIPANEPGLVDPTTPIPPPPPPQPGEGIPIRLIYKEQERHATLLPNGEVQLADGRVQSPKEARNTVAQAMGASPGTSQRLGYWKYQNESGKWRSIRKLLKAASGAG